MSYTYTVSSFVANMLASPVLTAAVWNELQSVTQKAFVNLEEDPEFVEDIQRQGIWILTQAGMAEKLRDMGWDEDAIQNSLEIVGIDDSYRASFLLDIRNPEQPRVVIPSEKSVFVEICKDSAMFQDGVFTWRAIEAYADAFLARGFLAVTVDEIIIFPVPSS